MNVRSTRMVIAGAFAALSVQAASAQELEELTVGYFLEWPMPMMAAKDSGAYDKHWV